MIRNIFRKIIYLNISFALIAASSHAIASDFSLPFINAAGLGTLYADWATSANDASTAYANPAGLVKLNHQQLMIGALGIQGNTRFTGTSIPSAPPAPPEKGSASSRIGAVFPVFYYAVPLSDKAAFGFGVNTPFALGTIYPKDSIVRYISTRSKVVVINISPSLGVQLTDRVSAGLGLDAARLAFTLNSMVESPIPFPDSESQNNLSGWGYGWHGGILFQATPCSRIGLSFNSRMMFHTTGESKIYAPLPLGNARTTNQRTYAALPARAQLTLQHDINQQWTIMGTFFYTNWSTLEKITMRHVIIPGGNTIAEVISLNFHNTFDYSVGTSYKINEKWLLRTGVQFMNTPSNARDRAVADPIGSATIVGFGAHYQQNPCIGYDVAYAHSFFKQASVHLSTPVAALIGHNNTQTNVFAAQMAWNIT